MQFGKVYRTDYKAKAVKNPVTEGTVIHRVSLQSCDVCAGIVTWCGIRGASPCLPGPWEAGRQWPLTSSPGTPLSWRLPGWRCSDRTSWPSSLSVRKEAVIFVLVLISEAVAAKLRHELMLLYSDLWGAIPHAWRPSVWWGGRIAESWPPSPSPSCG